MAYIYNLFGHEDIVKTPYFKVQLINSSNIVIPVKKKNGHVQMT